MSWATKDANVKAALDKFIAAAGEILPGAAALPASKWGSVHYGAQVNRISQAMAGELSLDEAFAKIDADVAQQVAAAQ